MSAWAVYNENDPFAAEWLRRLMVFGHIAPGEVDERSICDIGEDDHREFAQRHYFAGVAGWARALRLAGWPDDRPVWTGSCPCQPFSNAGKGGGVDDPRHLWPDFFRLIRAGRPEVVVGEQVSGKAGYGWLDGVRADLAGEDYACEAVDISACAVDAPHIRNRLYWIARRTGVGQADTRLLAGRRRSCDEGDGLVGPDVHGEGAVADTDVSLVQRIASTGQQSLSEQDPGTGVRAGSGDEFRGSGDVADTQRPRQAEDRRDAGEISGFSAQEREADDDAVVLGRVDAAAVVCVADTLEVRPGGLTLSARRDDGDRSEARRNEGADRASVSDEDELGDTVGRRLIGQGLPDGGRETVPVAPRTDGREQIGSDRRGVALGDAASVRRGEGWPEHELLGGRGTSAGADARDPVGDPHHQGREIRPLGDQRGGVVRQEGQTAGAAGFGGERSSPTFWSNARWIDCHDGKSRRAESRIPLLVNGVSGRVAVGVSYEGDLSPEEAAHLINRVGAWRGFGNAIVPQLAAEVISAFMDVYG